ncbi:DDE-type integrase/transposase/recombinase [Deinococcus humi]|uniref:DDE-type integrase/transposase/recombinase n=1 Tax=Deinococcus humi TaxID=662880 RepID=UPI003CC82EFA
MPLGGDAGVPGGIWTLRHADVGGVTHWLWRAVDEHGVVLDVFLQAHWDTEAARSFFHRLLGEGRRAGGHSP